MAVSLNFFAGLAMVLLLLPKRAEIRSINSPAKFVSGESKTCSSSEANTAFSCDAVLGIVSLIFLIVYIALFIWYYNTRLNAIQGLRPIMLSLISIKSLSFLLFYSLHGTPYHEYLSSLLTVAHLICVFHLLKHGWTHVESVFEGFDRFVITACLGAQSLCYIANAMPFPTSGLTVIKDMLFLIDCSTAFLVLIWVLTMIYNNMSSLIVTRRDRRVYRGRLVFALVLVYLFFNTLENELGHKATCDHCLNKVRVYFLTEGFSMLFLTSLRGNVLKTGPDVEPDASGVRWVTGSTVSKKPEKPDDVI